MHYSVANPEIYWDIKYRIPREDRAYKKVVVVSKMAAALYKMQQPIAATTTSSPSFEDLMEKAANESEDDEDSLDKEDDIEQSAAIYAEFATKKLNLLLADQEKEIKECELREENEWYLALEREIFGNNYIVY